MGSGEGVRRVLGDQGARFGGGGVMVTASRYPTPVLLAGTAMKKPFASTSRSRGKNRPISNCIAKMSSCSSSEVLGFGVDTPQLAAG